MPSIKLIKDTIKPEYLEQIQKAKSKLEKATDHYKADVIETIQKTFWKTPNLEDPRLSEAAKQI